jgi:hypothetical protein
VSQTKVVKAYIIGYVGAVSDWFSQGRKNNKNFKFEFNFSIMQQLRMMNQVANPVKQNPSRRDKFTQVFKKCPTLYGTLNFTTVFKKARQMSQSCNSYENQNLINASYVTKKRMWFIRY